MVGERTNIEYHARQIAQQMPCLMSEVSQLRAKNKRLREAIKGAIRIKDLWTLKEVESMFEDEAKALQAMLVRFEQALKGD